MTKYKIGDTGQLTIFDKDTGAVIVEKEINIKESRFEEFIDAYSALKKDSRYEDNKDLVRNNLIKEYFMD